MRILVDADACPKKEAIIQEAQNYQIPVLLISSISHFSTKELPDGIERIWVDKGSDQADFKIMKLAYPNDIVVTQDYGLASMLLPKQCRVLHHEGYEYTNKSIQKLIDGRHLSAQMRRQSKKSKVKSLNPFADETQRAFDELLRQVIEEQLEQTERIDQSSDNDRADGMERS
ncbi:MAG: YaiI/YqxD family protein [Alkalibacterium sp.]|nr:YaiI/YqxD family protein [Alkalibacterium sp.]